MSVHQRSVYSLQPNLVAEQTNYYSKLESSKDLVGREVVSLAFDTSKYMAYADLEIKMTPEQFYAWLNWLNESYAQVLKARKKENKKKQMDFAEEIDFCFLLNNGKYTNVKSKLRK